MDGMVENRQLRSEIKTGGNQQIRMIRMNQSDNRAHHTYPSAKGGAKRYPLGAPYFSGARGAPALLLISHMLRVAQAFAVADGCSFWRNSSFCSRFFSRAGSALHFYIAFSRPCFWGGAAAVFMMCGSFAGAALVVCRFGEKTYS